MQPATIVPPNRLGQLLAEARLRRGDDLADVAERSSGSFTIGELSDLEAGHRLLDDALIRQVTELYEIGCGPIIPQRAELTIDLDNNIVSAAGRAIPLDSAARDHILDRYLSLLYILRNREPGTTVPLRGEDLAILAASLAERSELLEEQLLAAMWSESEPVNRMVRWFRERLWVPGAGALVGAVSIGTLVLISSDDAVNAVETASRLTVGPSTVPPSPPTPSTTPSTDVSVAIADAATLVETSIPVSTSTTPDVSTTLTTSPASSTTAESSDAVPAPAELGARAEALLPFDWREVLPGWTITYHDSDASFRGLTFPYDRSIELYVRSSDTPESLAGIIAHELGHAIDVTYLDERDRSVWMEARGIEDEPWWPTAYASDFETGAGDFAEIFAFWALGDASSSRIAGPPTAAQVATLEALVDPHI